MGMLKSISFSTNIAYIGAKFKTMNMKFDVATARKVNAAPEPLEWF
jgi:hypothetical protein